MKPFSMEPVLRYRKQLEDEARQKLFISQKKETEISRQVENAKQVVTDLYANFECEKKEGTTVDRLHGDAGVCSMPVRKKKGLRNSKKNKILPINNLKNDRKPPCSTRSQCYDTAADDQKKFWVNQHGWTRLAGHKIDTASLL